MCIKYLPMMMVVMAATQCAGKTMPKDSICCPLLLNGHREAFEKCSEGLDPLLDCSQHQTKCMYNNKWYINGETVSTLASKCIKLTCHIPPPGSENVWPMLKIIDVDVGLNCCENKGQLYPSGYSLNGNKDKCTREVCSDGKWYTELDNECCVYESEVYFPGEIIDVGPGGDDCWKLWCTASKVEKTQLPCCCVYKKEMINCGVTLNQTTDTDSCQVDTCVNGMIIRSEYQGCCYVDGKLYKNNEVVDAQPDKCTVKVCVNTQVVDQPSFNCCKDLRGNWIQSTEILEKNEKKCLLKICQGNETIDKSLMDSCDCCEMGGQLYVEGAMVVLSPCIAITCRGSEWHRSYVLHNCEMFYATGDPHQKTFDGMYYDYYGKCNYTIVQKSCEGFTYPSIYTHFKNCGPPFKDTVSCNGEVTIKHSEHVVVTIGNGGTVKVNGREVDLPHSRYDDNLYIWDEGVEIKIITFNGFYVRYTKHSVMPALHVYAPKVEKNKGWCGLVGTYNGKKDDDFQARDGGLVDVATFAASWNTGVSTTNPKCKDKPDNIKPVCTKTQIKKFKPKCEALLALAKPNCTSPIKPEECVKDMCACVADDEETCFLVIKHTLEQLCGLQECHNEATDLKTRGCYDPQGVYYKEDARFLSECKVNICLQNKFYIFKDAGDQCCLEASAQTYYRNGEEYTVGKGDRCQSFVCTGGHPKLKGAC